MKFKEIIERAGAAPDDKARRVSNVSRKRANITADEIEDGVTIERLENVGVPVLRYATQITIHGKLPEFSERARPGGYKSIVRNQNGSVGVRYVAIDGAKKVQIAKASRIARVANWKAHINSTGLTIIGYFAEKAECLAALKSFPRHLFAGSAFAAAGMFGGYYVVAEVGAIYERHLWMLIEAVFGIASAEELEQRATALDQQHEREREQGDRQAEARIAARKAELETLKAETAATITQPVMRDVPKGPGAFVRATWRGPLLYILKRRGPQLCYSVVRYTNGMDATPFLTSETTGKMKRFDAMKRAAVEADAAAGFVFKA